MKRLLILAIISFLIAGCMGQASTPILPTPKPVTVSSAPSGSGSDFFTQNKINLPAPSCNGLTLAQTEGPYYKASTPERHSLLEEGTQGTRLIVVGRVLDQNCQPLSNAWLDFWQADANGNYDNQGDALRGHQFTDAQGRYYLETVRPGEYPGRTEHIHVKVQPPNGSVLTTQLYFPGVAQNPQDGIFDPSLIVKLEDKGDYLVAYFDFVVNQ